MHLEDLVTHRFNTDPKELVIITNARAVEQKVGVRSSWNSEIEGPVQWSNGGRGTQGRPWEDFLGRSGDRGFWYVHTYLLTVTKVQETSLKRTVLINIPCIGNTN